MLKHVTKIVVVGLGYVGLPLLIALEKALVPRKGNIPLDIFGYDIDHNRVDELSVGIDKTSEIESYDLLSTTAIFTTEPGCIRNDRFGETIIIVTVPTPITSANVPDLTPVIKATEQIGANISPNTTVIYESTVYPGVTEDICVPILEKFSAMIYKEEFWVGYSPERINPGDKINTLSTVTKIVSGDNESTLSIVDELYSSITKTYRASSIRVAEAAKVIENTQRDINIALMNELSAIFSRLNIDTTDVIDAATSKWNFVKYTPGLVGGHCISVDPYYLTHRAQEAGYVPSLILAAREVNDRTPSLVVLNTLQALSKIKRLSAGTIVTILGVTFKENVPDIRNSKVFGMIKELNDWGIKVQVIDPLADDEELLKEHGIQLTASEDYVRADAIIYAVPHTTFIGGGWQWIRCLLTEGPAVVMDVKSVLDRDETPSNIKLVRM
jgi:UDP-N-acetyl-D-glucosamine/UDP-N-acetyl-D-galactosamine dehydrogenase